MTSEDNRGLVVTGTPTGTHTQYLVIYPTGAETYDVHEMIDRVMMDRDLPPEYKITGVMLIVNDEQAPVWVTPNDISDGQGLEWDITRGALPGGGDVLEYVLYDDDERAKCHTDDVYVEGFAEEPGVPEYDEDE